MGHKARAKALIIPYSCIYQGRQIAPLNASWSDFSWAKA